VIPRAWAARSPRPQVTVAEIDPAVTAMAVRDFWFDPEGTEILHEDARRALARRADLYDVIIGDAFTDIAVPQHLITREFFELAASRLAPGGVYLMNVIDHADSLAALAALHATAQEVFPVVEVWTVAQQMEPGARRIFVLAAGESATKVDFLRARAPLPQGYGRLPEDFLAALRAQHGSMIFTDNYAPIDRLLGWTF
jgi:spermidine synthase